MRGRGEQGAIRGHLDEFKTDLPVVQRGT